jgi:hypothetical protein
LAQEGQQESSSPCQASKFIADALQRWDSLLDCVGFADLPSTLFNQSGKEHNSNLIRIAQFAIRPEATLTVDEVVQPSGEPSRDEED